MCNFKIFIVVFCVGLLISCQETKEESVNLENNKKVDYSPDLSKLDKKKLQESIKRQSPSNETNTEPSIDWLSIDDLGTFKNTENKKYIVDVYTSWCGWCKVMDRQTFASNDFQAYIDDKFHLVKFDAEQKEPVTFKGETYEWQEGGRKGVNRLALKLLENRLSYPSLVFLDENLNKIKISPGFKKPDQLISELEKL